ncbi:MAG: ATP-binding protein [Candidatus Pacebacteria bacterium]|nr:ATP-binding protein [Candidatus Paceibacterota bacterium]
MNQKRQQVTSAVLRPHRMGLVFKSVADTYPTLRLSIQELIQNSIDVDAKNIEVIINAQGNFVVVHDNGSGATKNDFNQALQSVLKSSKDKDKFGRFGRGTISPLTKCREFTFMSRGRTGPSHRWTFHCKEILESEDFPQIPCEDVGSGGGQWWRTEVQLKGVKFSEDAVKYAVNLEELKNAVLASFATRMRKLGTVVRMAYQPASGKVQELTFSAKSYGGEKLPVWVSEDETPAGKVCISLYLNTKGTSPIPITIGQTSDPFRVDWKTFYASVNSFAKQNKRVTFDTSGKEINDLFRSGLLTGEIECENITIHPEREKFERNEALDYFVMILEEWFQKVGKDIYAQAQIRAKSTLYQEAALEATRRIENHPLVAEFLKMVKFGTVGKGHASVNAKPVGEVTSSSVNLGRDQGKGTSVPEEGSTVNGPNDKVTRPGQVPLVVDGPEGSKRTIVRGESKGLRIAIEPFPGFGGVEAPLFKMQVEAGLVIINQLAPSFNSCADRGKSPLHRYIDMVIVAALQSTVAMDPTRVQSDLEQYIRYTNTAFLRGDQREL